MKKKWMSRVLSLLLVLTMTETMLPVNLQLVYAEEKAVLADGVNDEWTLENKVGEDAVCAVEDGWLHIRSGVGNGNDPGTNPAMFVNQNTFDFNKNGYIEFTMKSNNTNTAQTGSDRFGVYLGYNTDQNGMFVGYDNGGWFWQKYTGGGGEWYSGGRTAAPAQGAEVSVRIDWTADHKMTLTLDGTAVFTNEDFSSIAGTLGNQIAMKGGSYSGSTVTDVLLKDIHYTGQKETVTADGINDGWIHENPKDGSVCAVENGWLHLKSDPTHGNNPGSNPAIFKNPNTFNFNEAGFVAFTMKSNNTVTDRFGVYLGYNTDKNGMYVGYDAGGWFWQKYTGGSGEWYSGGRTAAPAQGAEVSVRIDWTADHKMTLTLNGTKVFDNEDFSAIAGTLGNEIALKGGSFGGSITDVFLKDIHYTGQKETEMVTYAVSGTVKDANGLAIEGAAVKLADKTVYTDAEGKYSFWVPAGDYVLTVTKKGYQTAAKEVTVHDADVTVEAIQMEEVIPVATRILSTEDMDVYAAENFPSVVKYEMKKGDLAGKTFYGQTSEINTIRINGTDVNLTKDDVETVFEADRAEYTMTVKGENIDAVIKAELAAEKNTLAFNITEIKNNLKDAVDGQPIQTIEIPRHSLISVGSDQAGANLMGAAMSQNTKVSGDEYIEVNDAVKIGERDYMYAFVSNDEMSAGLWSNSEHEGRTVSVVASGGSANTRIISCAEQKDGYVSMGLSSAAWYYHRVVKDSKGVRYVVKETDMPKTKIIIAGDENWDNQIDWQDGAVAFRKIMNNPFKSEEVPELVAYRIAMNFGGQAQNPFLTTLDNVKRVAMHTDGLGQSVLLKGYGNEGHDSGHPDYDDIGTRIGGAEDMNTLMTKGALYGARFGIHVNAGEMYPESKAFSDELVRRDGNGNLRYGWNWIDQGVGIDSIYDLANGLRKSRFDALEAKVGQNLDFVYVDIWGNNTGSDLDDSWQTRKLSKEINDNGWRMANEWGCANEYDATFQHWATDLTYGGAKEKGENSEVMRFLRNHQKDSWIGDYPSYGGAAMAPLLGGYNMKDFEGWQGRNDYDTYITNLYTHDVTTKFIQHYEIVKWEDGEPVNAGGAANWVPEMKITLKDADGDTLVLERGSNDPNNAAYRERTMTLNGKVIAKGAASRGDRSNADIQNGMNKGTETYLLPWNWDSATGEKTALADEKLYHWNTRGGTTEWELPDSWKNLSDVIVYKLTDIGKTQEQTVAVVNGKITLTAESEIPYVVCKGKKANPDITWSEGMHIIDAGFNSGNFDAWTKNGEGKAELAKSQYSNPMMKLSGEVSMSQKLTDLTAGKQYAVLAGVDNRSDAKAIMTVSNGENVLASNYTIRSIAKNYVKAYTHSNSSATVDGSSYFQNMYIFFTAPESGDVVLTLSREAGEGDTYFDDIRIVENESENITLDEKGNVVKFEQDFETNVQGIYPFVIAGLEGVEDNRTHLSELHAPYTQAGWDVKKMDDVLDGKWSVKVNGLAKYNNLVYQTIPQNFRFEAGKKYKVSFDYEAGSDDIYAFAAGTGEYSGTADLTMLKKALGTKGHFETDIIGSASEQTWVGIYSTNIAPDLQGTSGAASNFGGYKDLVLDNLVIEKVEELITAEDLKALLEEAYAFERADYTAEDWAVLEEAVTAAEVALDRDTVRQEEIEEAYYKLRGAVLSMEAIVLESSEVNDIPVEGVVVTAGSEDLVTFGSSGPKELAIDGNPDTAWVTDYNGYGSCIKDGDAWINLHYPQAHTVDGFRYLPAQSSLGYDGYQAITKYEIWVKTADNDEYQKVAAGDWAFDSSWKLVNFEPVENVTDVKLVAVEALAYNWWATAAEIRATSKAETVTEDLPVNKEGLGQAIEAVKALNPEAYTEESWKVVAEKLVKAEAVFADENATNYDVLLAIANLEDAVAILEEKILPVPGDNTELKAALEKCRNLESKDYTEASWRVFEEAYEYAAEVAADEEALQEEIDKALDALKTALKNLVKAETSNPADKTKLEKFYKECLAYYVEKNHSKENWKEYQSALAEAKNVLDNPDAVQKDVDAAMARLVKITKTMNAELGNPSDKPVETGDNTPVATWILVSLFAAIVIIALFVMKRRKAVE